LSSIQSWAQATGSNLPLNQGILNSQKNTKRQYSDNGKNDIPLVVDFQEPANDGIARCDFPSFWKKRKFCEPGE